MKLKLVFGLTFFTASLYSVGALAGAPKPADPNDLDRDGVVDTVDNCPGVKNPVQEDGDTNGVGDHCEPATAVNLQTLPVGVLIPGQEVHFVVTAINDWGHVDTTYNANASVSWGFISPNINLASGTMVNGLALLPWTAEEITSSTHGIFAIRADVVGLPVVYEKVQFARDTDGDGLYDHLDNCPGRANPDQADMDGDGHGDLCEPAIWNNANILVDSAVILGGTYVVNIEILNADGNVDTDHNGEVRLRALNEGYEETTISDQGRASFHWTPTKLGTRELSLASGNHFIKTKHVKVVEKPTISLDNKGYNVVEGSYISIQATVDVPAPEGLGVCPSSEAILGMDEDKQAKLYSDYTVGPTDCMYFEPGSQSLEILIHAAADDTYTASEGLEGMRIVLSPTNLDANTFGSTNVFIYDQPGPNDCDVELPLQEYVRGEDPSHIYPHFLEEGKTYCVPGAGSLYIENADHRNCGLLKVNYTNHSELLYSYDKVYGARSFELLPSEYNNHCSRFYVYTIAPVSSGR